MEAMAKFTLIERPAPGDPPADQTFVPPNHHCLLTARNHWAINSSSSTGRWSTRTEISSARSCSMHRLMSSAIARLPTTGSPTLSSSGRLLITERRVFWMLSPTPERPKSPLIDTLHQEQLPGKDA